MPPPEPRQSNYTASTCVGCKRYELTNHLGNVVTVISDKKIPHSIDNNGNVDYYTADIISTTDYYPFGMPMPERNYASADYRFGFGGHEKDNEVSGDGNHLAFGDYGYDTRLGRRWNIDPFVKKYPAQTPYLGFDNNPLCFRDKTGKDGSISITGNTITVSANIYIYGSNATNKMAQTIQENIMDTWNAGYKYVDPKTNKTYNVKFDVKVQLYEGKEKNSPLIIPESYDVLNRDNFVEVSEFKEPSVVVGGDEGRWNSSDMKKGWVASHEFGHLIGLKDRYSEKYDKGNRKTIADNDWKGNIMADYGGKVDQRNINAVVGEYVDQYNKDVSKYKKADANKDSGYGRAISTEKNYNSMKQNGTWKKEINNDINTK